MKSRGQINLTNEALASILKLQPGEEIVTVDYDPRRECLSLIIGANQETKHTVYTQEGATISSFSIDLPVTV